MSTQDRAIIYGHNIGNIVTLEGPDFKDVMGNAKKNSLRGDSAGNALDGGDGSDTLFGLGGKDVFMFGDALNKRNIDTIKDFKHNTDKIQLDSEIFRGLKEGKLSRSEFYLGSKAHDKNDHVLYDKNSGKLYFDADGSGHQAAVQFAILENKPINVGYNDFHII